MSTSKRPKLSIKFNQNEPNKIELFEEYRIDDQIKSTACIPYLEYLYKVHYLSDAILQVL
jgi:hypothetical protein